MPEKKVNYTEAQAAELVEAYTSAESAAEREMVIDEYSAEYAKSVKSIRQKLVREGVYVKKIRVTKTGGKVERKENIVADIARAMGCEAETLSGLEKATKATLELIRKQFVAVNALLAGEATLPDSE